LPPEAIEIMETRSSSEVVGKIEPTISIETTVKKDFGLERLIGLAPETLNDLERIKNRLQDPKRAGFMKKYDFKQSSGAVFWGLPGTGKSLAVEALAEESGCQRIVLKVDEYMTAYLHESASKIGERLREIKTQSSQKEKPIIIHIDEADTIIRPVNSRSSSEQDASEIRAVLLREFQEPSNVFYVLTTNIDPRDPGQADAAIVRNQRVGDFVAFGLPTEKGRSEIFDKEIKKRSGEDLIWENVNIDSLVASTNGFSPADVQEVLSVAVGLAYDSNKKTAIVNHQHLENAINIIRSRKLMEKEIRKPYGFINGQ
jgi:SpoVK/Ycf46/Vps4 family AAA+-type ATPase